jgi:hypothetical protein
LISNAFTFTFTIYLLSTAEKQGLNRLFVLFNMTLISCYRQCRIAVTQRVLLVMR